MTETELTIDELVSIYLKIRTAIEAKEEQHKTELQELKDQFDVVGNKLLEICNEQNISRNNLSPGVVTVLDERLGFDVSVHQEQRCTFPIGATNPQFQHATVLGGQPRQVSGWASE
jgi:hypothetical protein